MKKIKIQSILYLYIILCPILDCASFIFRNSLNTSISPSTIIRPIFVLITCLYIFITDKKQRKIFILAGFTYGIYALVHLYIFTLVKNNSSYSGIIHELQYLVNYTFMVLNLYVYIYVFIKSEDTKKLIKCILTSVSIYILSIYLSILTGTSSHTYMLEQMGYKGWFESGNSLSAILILSMFILVNIFSKKTISKKTKIWTGIIITLIGIFLMSLIGTRVGLFGFILVIGIFIVAQLINNIIHRKKVKQTIIISGILLFIAITGIIMTFKVFGSNTLDRREKVEEMANILIDEETNEQIHITGDMHRIKKQMKDSTIEQGFMSKEQQQTVLKLDEIATKYNLSVEQMRILQLIYNIELANNQSSLIYRLFGNGYVCQYREMILEMELLAIPINFGIYGFILYLIPFIAVYCYSLCKGLTNIKKIDVEYMMLISGGGLAFTLSLLSGYIFFNASTTMIIILINLLLLIKVKEISKLPKLLEEKNKI